MDKHMVITSEKSSLPLTNFVRAVQNNRGFTLIELIMVVAIIGTLAMFVIPAYSALTDRARISRSASEIRGIEKDIAAYATDNVFNPANLGIIGRAGQLDPWGNLYIYSSTTGTRTYFGDPISSDYDLYSLGSDGLTDPDILDAKSLDDIMRANDGAFCNISNMYSIL